MPLTALLSDSFDRSDRDLNGDTLDNAGGGSGTHTWSALSGSWDILTLRARCASGGDNAIIVGTMANTADQRVSIVSRAAGSSLVARTTDGTDGYIAFRFGNDAYAVYKANGTPLGGTSSGVAANGDLMALECIGDQITFKVNGSTVLGPFTDSTYTSGKAGLWNPSGSAGICDDFLVETSGAGTPPNATYAPFTLLCEAAHANITPTNTGDPITSMTRTGGSAVPAGVVVGADGTITITAASMLAADIGDYDIIYTAANAAGSQTGVHVVFSITANAAQRHYANAPFTKFCAHNSSTAAITNDGGATPATYSISPSVGGMAINSGTGLVTFDPDLTERMRPTTFVVTMTTTGGQVSTTTFSAQFGFQFTARATNAGGDGDGIVTLLLGGGGTGQGGSIRRAAFAESSFHRSSFRSSAIGGGDAFR